MILAILQARVSSTRLPGKVLKPVLGEPMLYRQIERLRRSHRFDVLLVATSTDPSDDGIEALCREKGVKCFRGALKDVLDRFYQAALAYSPSHIVRLTGDCPLADPELIDEIIDFHLSGRFDYTSNTLEETFPNGLDAEVFSPHCLEDAWREARLPSQREHVTPFIYNNPARYRLGSYRSVANLSDMRWTVDEQADLDMVRRVFCALYPANPLFSTRDIIEFLEREPEVGAINASIGRNEGYLKSLEEDAYFLKENRG